MNRFMFCFLTIFVVGSFCIFMDNKPALIQLTEPFDHGESPTWDGRKNILFFVDSYLISTPGRIISYSYESGSIKSIELDGSISPVVQCKDPKKLLAGVNKTLVTVEWDGLSDTKIENVKKLTTVAKDNSETHFNDGKTDEKGRLWVGTLTETLDGDIKTNKSFFYKISKDNLNSPEIELSSVTISNGLAWNKANDQLYYIDSSTLQIAVFDYDNEKGEISNKRIAFDVGKEPSLEGIPGLIPDGMTVDENDNLWIALYGGGSVIHVNPNTSKLLKRWPIPAQYVTSVMFGGPNLDILFVTTSRHLLSEQKRKGQPSAGALFALKNLGVKGRPVFEADF